MSRRPRKVMAQMNVVPYIDVMLVLLVIFMVTAPMMQTGVDVNAPDAQANELKSDSALEPLTISMSKEGQYFLDKDSPLSEAQLVQYISSQLDPKAERAVYIKADDTATTGHLMKAMAAAQRAGAKKISILADPVPAKPN